MRNTIVKICGLLGVLVMISGFSYAAVGTVYINKNTAKTYEDISGNEYTIYKNPTITVITPKNFSFHFKSEGVTARSLQNEYGCNAVLNSTYFGFADGGGYFPAGIWYEFGSLIREPYRDGTDINLQVLMGSDGKNIALFDNKGFNFSTLLQNGSWAWYMNAGPWLVRDGVIERSIVYNNSHWQRSATRSAILIGADKSVKFLVSTRPISLPQFILFVYKTGLGDGAFNLVNLDGGSSTSLLTPYNSYNATKRLPAFICVK